MPIVKKSRYEQLRFENEKIRQDLERWEDLSPFLAIAEDVKQKIIENLDHDVNGQSAAEIGEIAYRSVLESESARLRGLLAQEYEHAHRNALFERAIDEISETEGAIISQEIKERLETDAEFLKELLDSARNELRTEAGLTIREELKASQQEVIDAEAKRQVELDYLDVQFIHDQKLTLDQTVSEKLQTNDYLSIKLSGEDGKLIETPLIFDWRQSADGTHGWVLRVTDAAAKMFTIVDVPQNRFIELGIIVDDFTSGKLKYRKNELQPKTELVAIWRDDNNKEQAKVIHSVVISETSTHDSTWNPQTHRHERYYAPRIVGTDFNTRQFSFVE